MEIDHDRNDRRSALDDYAKMGDRDQSLPAVQTFQQLPNSMAQFMENPGAVNVAKPRDERALLDKLKVLAAAAGSDWYYRFPVRDNKSGTTKYIEGPSIKLAMELSRLYGNCNVFCLPIDLDGFWMIHAKFHDVESGYMLVRPFQQRKDASRLGGTDDGRRLEIALAIGVSKALRNVIVNALPTLTDFCFEEARNALVDKIGGDLAKYRERTAERVSSHVDLKRVEAVIGRTKDEWLAPDVAKIIAMMKAIQDGFASIEDTFPPLGTEAASTTSTTEKLDSFALKDQQDGGAGEGKPATKATPPRETGTADEPRSDAGAGEGGKQVASASSPAEIINTLRERIGLATDAETIQEIWDQLDIDGKFQADPSAKQRANKVVSERKKELGL